MARVMHPLNYLLIPLISIVAIFNTIHGIAYLLILLISVLPLLLSARRISYLPIFLFILSLIPGFLGYYLASRYFSGNDVATTTNLLLRLFSLSFVSFIYIINLPSEQLIIELMQRKLIRIKIGFALLATSNALTTLKQEFSKIQTSYKMRFGKHALSPMIALPLLVSASRYAHNISISLHSRGISEKRSFMRAKTPWTIFDTIVIFSILSTLLIANFKLKCCI